MWWIFKVRDERDDALQAINSGSRDPKMVYKHLRYQRINNAIWATAVVLALGALFLVYLYSQPR